MAFTPNFDIEIPDVGADFDTWGGILNNALGVGGGGPASALNFDQLIQDNLDAAAAAQATADAALPLAGGIMTGRQDSFTGSVESIDLAQLSSVVNMDIGLANFFLAAPAAGSGAPIYTFTNEPAVAPKVLIAFLSLFQGAAAASVSWGASIIWPGGTSGPALSLTGTDLLGFYSPDQGTTWYGSLAQSDVR